MMNYGCETKESDIDFWIKGIMRGCVYTNLYFMIACAREEIRNGKN